MQILLATVAGVTLGGVFALLKLPVPAPSTFTGVMGLFGITVGYLIVVNLTKTI